jgi:AcrR family transcriptional regulator
MAGDVPSTITLPPSASTVPSDGRRARRHRSRDLAVDAVLDLLNDGVPRPTAQQVAERSGVSLRSIFRIFDDVETLHATAAARQQDRVRHLFVNVDLDGPQDARADAIARVTAGVYAEVAPVRRAALRTAPESEVLRAELDRARVWLRREIERVFEVELSAVDDDGITYAALESVLSFETWDQLRNGQGVSAARARTITTRMLLALVGPAGS